MKKVKQISIWLTLVIYLLVTMSFVSKKYDQILCNTLDIIIVDSLQNRFLSDDDIEAILDLHKIPILGEPIKEVNTLTIESKIVQNAAVKSVEAYKTVSGHLKIKIEQRTPILRIIDNKQRGFYMDKDGYIMPLSVKYSSHVIVLNGHIPEVVPINFSGNIGSLDQSKKGVQELKNVFELAKYIYEDKFWKAQFVQMYMDKKGEIELVPRVGAHMIYFGKPDQIENKFMKLEALYDKGFTELGWNNYEKISLKYSNQIICTKR